MPNFKDDFDSLVGKTRLTEDLNRRTFMKAALGTGFAAAVLPVCAQTVIKTDTVGLTAGSLEVQMNGLTVPVYRAQPEGKTNLPVVLVISEIFGVHEHIADVARRFAKFGYLAIAPDLFARQGNPAAFSSIAELQKEVVSKVPDDQIMGDLDACVAWAKANGGNIDKLAINGFCWGGRVTWLYCGHNPKVKAGAAWYGRLIGEKSALNPLQPIDITPTLKVPVLGLYGGKDEGITQDSIQQMKAALAKGSNKSIFVVYPNSGHAFNADYRPSYVEADAKDGWKRTIDWFKTHGVS
ncbi:dienelactone hydrolase family protein [Glaciimonas sp. PCH181]|uniref:dienelactone hydrolase family protein n=1 Tax=Glaciimonas sp. PCH181 TaxID=2133943 RepID=UPI000D390C55|nr:dienelactone hydrolase family protein [Glaciimonas sp. PCH181]PUA20589.1 carboxymethylenebutenolidase [Glaciimonas sp. PCH181]